MYTSIMDNQLFFFGMLLTAGAVGMHTDCYMNGISQCDYIKEPKSLPDSFDELKQDCNVIQELLKCAVNVSKECPGSENFTDKLEKLLTYIEKNCQEDSHIYQVISQNYECILPLARNAEEECSLHHLHYDDLNKLMSIVKELKHMSGCVEIIYDITCSAHIIGLQCGQEVKNVVTDILKNIEWDYEECSEETLRELLPFQEAVESAITRNRMTNNVTTLECPVKNGYYGVPGDCTSYLKCFKGKGEIEPCPEGFVFDSTKYCTTPDDDNPDCGFPTPEQKELNSYCTEDYGHFPHHDCHKYVICIQGRGTLKSCLENYVYYKWSGCVVSDTCIQ